MKKTFSKRQISEAISYWKEQLRLMNESDSVRPNYLQGVTGTRESEITADVMLLADGRHSADIMSEVVISASGLPERLTPENMYEAACEGLKDEDPDVDLSRGIRVMTAQVHYGDTGFYLDFEDFFDDEEWRADRFEEGWITVSVGSDGEGVKICRDGSTVEQL